MNKLLILLVAISAISLVSATGIIFAIVHVNINVGVLEPISPTSINIGYSEGQHGGSCSGGCMDQTVTNNANESINVLVTFEHAISVGGYTTNAPFNQTLIPGDNQVNFCLYLIGCNSQTVFTSGNIIITRL